MEIKNNIITFEEDFEQSFLNINTDDMLYKFNIPYLDCALKGLFKKDLLLITAESGAGKSEISTMMACNFAQQGLRVLYFALEYDKGEVADRIIYREFANIIQDEPDYKKLDFDSYCAGEFRELANKYKADLWENLKNLNKSLCIRYKSDSFYSEDLYKELIENANNFDIIIVDHLSFIDGTNDGNENKLHQEIMVKTKNFCSEFEKPVVMVVHLRKKDRKTKGFMPVPEDISGTKHILNCCTRAIFLSPDYEYNGELESCLYPTFIRIGKNRKGHAKTRYAFRMFFDSRKNEYKKRGNLLKIKGDCVSFDEMEQSQTPYWFDNNLLQNSYKYKKKNNASLY